jgi:hypothetical protein
LVTIGSNPIGNQTPESGRVKVPIRTQVQLRGEHGEKFDLLDPKEVDSCGHLACLLDLACENLQQERFPTPSPAEDHAQAVPLFHQKV